jgi:hypothetical protein
MGLPWVRLDTGFAQNPKILHLVEDRKWQAVTVYVAGLGYSGLHGTAGFLPFSALPFIHGTKKTANDLLEIELWTPAQGGYDINGWAEYQPTDDDAKRRREKAKHAAAVRWGNKNGRPKSDQLRVAE